MCCWNFANIFWPKALSTQENNFQTIPKRNMYGNYYLLVYVHFIHITELDCINKILEEYSIFQHVQILHLFSIALSVKPATKCALEFSSPISDSSMLTCG